MEFEKILRDRIYSTLYDQYSYRIVDFRDGLWDFESTLIRIYDEYLTRIKPSPDTLSEEAEDEQFERLAGLEEQLEYEFSPQYLSEFEDTLTDDELNYIKYCAISEKFHGEFHGRDSGSLAKTENFMVKKLLSKMKDFSEAEIQELIDSYKTSHSNADCIYCDIVKKIIDKSLYKGIDEKLDKEEKKVIEAEFNRRINCGGYAFKVDHCIFPFGEESMDKTVSIILDEYPFVRLLGDTEMNSDEYLVFFRKHGKNGHHFVRMEDDGTIMEKNAIEPIKKFNGWNEKLYKDSLEVCFAVKKEHDIDIGREYISTDNSICFEDAVRNAVKDKNNNFSYHDREYSFKKSEDAKDDVYIISNNEIIGYMIDDGEQQLIEVEPEKEAYVINCGPSIEEVIKSKKVLSTDDECK